MPFNGTGTFNRNFSWVTDAANGINITASRVDSDSNDFAGGLTNCITRDGQGKPTAAIDFNGQNLSNVNQLTSTGTTALGTGGGLVYVNKSVDSGLGQFQVMGTTNVADLAGTGNVKARIRSTGASSAATLSLQNGTSGTANADGFEIGLATDGITASLYNYENGGMTFSTNNTLRATISSAGLFTLTTVQPAVNAQRITSTQSLPVSTVTDVIFNSANTDQNSNYGTGTGIFTAPVAGVYVFSACLILQNNGAGSTFVNDIYFSKNNATAVGASRYSLPSVFSQGGQWNGALNPVVLGGNLVLRLAATDTIRIKVDLSSGASATPVLNIGSYFTAYLLG